MEQIIGNSILDQYFDEHTMSLHLKENSPIFQKKGAPGNRQPVKSTEVMSKQAIQDLISKIYEEAENRDDWFLEIDRKLSKVLQVWPYRIVIVYPPLSDWLEMTVVKPIVRLSIEDYNLSADVFDQIRHKSKWILISGAPGSGKTTFAQALIDVYHKDNKIIKTVESPRDLQVDNDIVQYSFTYGTHDEVRDILLLSRPDYTVYDEVRNKSDFELYKDLRLTGIWLVWVIHATRPVDSIQRFLGTIEMGIIPQVIDTVIYIEDWKINEIYQLTLTVKVPDWMMSDELARPVIVITSFLSKNIEYEIYTFWEQIVVMPVWQNILKDEKWQIRKSPKDNINEYASHWITKKLEQLIPCWFISKVKWTSIDLYIPESFKWRIIGKWGSTINDLEKSIWLSINVKSFDDLPLIDEKTDISEWKKGWSLNISFPNSLAQKTLNLIVWDEIIRVATDANWVTSISNKPLIKAIQKRWFIVVDDNKL